MNIRTKKRDTLMGYPFSYCYENRLEPIYIQMSDGHLLVVGLDGDRQSGGLSVTAGWTAVKP